MKCPRCGSETCQIITESQMKTKGFGFGKGCCGYLLVGPIGWLCGLCGMGEFKTTTRHFWICNHCGNKFRA